MKQSEVNALLAERGFAKLEGSSRRLAEQQIRVELLFQRAGDALGQYSKQAGTLFAAQQTLRAEFNNMQAVVGYALTPAFAELALSLRPLVQELVPVMVAIFKSVIPVVQDLTSNKERLVEVVISVAKAFLVITQTIVGVTSFVIKNIEAIRFLIVTMGTLLITVKIWQVMATGIMLANSKLVTMNVTLIKTAKALRIVKLAIASTGFGLIALGVGAVATAVMGATDDIDESLADLDAQLKGFDSGGFEADVLAATEGMAALDQSMSEAAGGAGAAKNAIGDFFKSMADDSRKLSARLQLETFGASAGLIEKILGSGEDWYKVFEEVTRQGMSSVQNVQAMFLQTAAGFDEAMDKWQQEFDAFKEFEKQALAAKDAFVEFAREFKVLPSIAEQIGEFERSSIDKLSSFEDKLKEAFDNGYLLDESYQNLLAYARDEFSVLRQIERQRDSLLARRNAAEQLITQVQQSIAGSASLVDLMRNVQDSAEQVNIVEFAQRTVSAGNELREFRTALISNFSEPIEQAGSSAAKLVQSYRSVVERTREFVENLKALRALGLDPQLFNQLVQAGVEAGGATAQALVEGGADTITEINGLFAELDALGVELGENTAQVMYGQGENFVDGIVKGLESQLDELESMANSLAESFTTTFEEVLIAGIERAIAAAEAALSRMPQAPNMNFDFGGGGGGGGGGDGTPKYTIPEGGGKLPSFVPNLTAPTKTPGALLRGVPTMSPQQVNIEKAKSFPGFAQQNTFNINNNSPSNRLFENRLVEVATKTANSNSGSRSQLSGKVG
jgi:hypothetical protein